MEKTLSQFILENVDAATYIKCWPSGHDWRTVCPRCKADCLNTALIEVAYVFERCDCGAPAFTHLVEQLWHRFCFLKEKP